MFVFTQYHSVHICVTNFNYQCFKEILMFYIFCLLVMYFVVFKLLEPSHSSEHLNIVYTVTNSLILDNSVSRQARLLTGVSLYLLGNII